MNKLFLFIAIAYILCMEVASSQTRSFYPDKNRANIWYFGFPATGFDFPGLDFNSGQPVVLTNGKAGDRGTSTLCDAFGNLQMYVVPNGQSGYILNANHDTLHNSWNMFDVPLFGGLWAHTQRFLTIPNPSGNGLVYVFTSGNQANINTYEYSTVDMNLEGGLGSVIEKNHFLYLRPTGKQSAVHHSNCHDIWVVSRAGNSNNFYAYLVTDTGVTSTPVISSAGVVLNVGQSYAFDMKLSPNGRKIAFVTSIIYITQLLDFDNSTGIVSNPVTLPTDSIGEYSLSFSPDGSKLYVDYPAAPGRIYQYDVSTGDSASIVNSRTLIAQTLAPGYGFFGMELGPDGKIYISKFTDWNMIDSLAVIHSPNNPGAACNFQLHAVRLYGRSGHSLNNTIQSYFNEDPAAYKCFTGTTEQLFNEPHSVIVHPNPFSDKVKIFINPPVENCSVILYDLSGKEAVSMKKSNVGYAEIERGNLPDGVYILKIQGNHIFYTCKLLAINPLKN